MKSLVLFSNDLRLNDNDAINASAINGITSTFVFVYDEKLYAETHGSANLWWLEKSLTSLQSRLAEKSIKLHILDGELVSTVTKIVEKHSFEALYLNRNKHPSFSRAEDHIENNLKKLNVSFNTFNKATLADPSTILNKSNEPYKVYTPFYKHCKSLYFQKDVLTFPTEPIKTYDLCRS